MRAASSPASKQAFSLVELSIVLVILGLLTGGILAGQSLIRAAELRSITTDFSNYQTAVRAFQDKYFALPGDMSNATSFWGFAGGTTGTDNACYQSTTASGTETCNGNGNGEINAAAAADEYGEVFMFWQHLANSGLIEGTYSGIAGSASVSDSEIGENVPSSKVSGGGWYAEEWDGAPDANAFARNYGSWLMLGSASAINLNNGTIIKAEEMWGIDKKIDDGLPAYGRVFSRNNSGRPDCVTTDVASTAEYDLANNEIGCTLYILTKW